MSATAGLFSVLIVDNDANSRDSLHTLLASRFVLIESVASIDDAQALSERCHFDVIIAELNLPQRTLFNWPEVFEAGRQQADIILMTQHPSVEQSIEAVRCGVSDFIIKPLCAEKVLNAIDACLEKRLNKRAQLTFTRPVLYEQPNVMVGQSEAIKNIQATLSRIAPSQASILIEGESGTGKELVAKQLHVLSGRKGEFVALNCGAISPELLESELFGHEAGAYTGAKVRKQGLFNFANKGTVFLDEIGEMPVKMQAALLRVLEQKKVRAIGSEQEKPVDVRVLAATNRSLEQEVAAGNFRRDLFYRLNVINVTLPPLRERPEDIVALTHHFISELTLELGINDIIWSYSDLHVLQQYHWPGNIRELKNVISRCILLGKLPTQYWQEVAMPQKVSHHGYPVQWPLKEVEKAHILNVIDWQSGNKSLAASQLGVSRKTLERKFKEWFA